MRDIWKKISLNLDIASIVEGESSVTVGAVARFSYTVHLTAEEPSAQALKSSRKNKATKDDEDQDVVFAHAPCWPQVGTHGRFTLQRELIATIAPSYSTVSPIGGSCLLKAPAMQHFSLLNGSATSLI
jgi:hypothetical protein